MLAQKLGSPARRERRERSYSEEAYTRIKERILRGEYSLGAPLSRRHLAAQFRMSLLPISDALKRLELDGLVEVRPRAGTRVRIPSQRELEEHVIVREALECQAARMFSERATGKQREELVRQAEFLDAQQLGVDGVRLSAEVSYAVHRHHLEFHRRVAEGTQCGALVTLIESNRVLVFNWLFDLAAGDYVLPAHRELALLLGTADPVAAEEAMREHVRYGRHRMLGALGGMVPQVVWRQRKPPLSDP
jgi:DNA-binding GntR family transcriptional regulator